MVFHVYVDGVTGTAPEAAWAVSEAMATRYGVPVAEAHARLMAGAFCVRANVDRTTAESFARDLAAIGARVRIEPSSGESSSHVPGGEVASGDVPVDAAVVGRPTRSALPPQPAVSGRPTRPSLLQMGTQPGRREPKPTTSALGAPRSSLSTLGGAGAAQVEQALGALAGGELSLSMLDNVPPPPRTTTPMPVSAAPKAVPAPKPPKPIDVPIDLFAPPSELEDELAVELAIDETALPFGSAAGRGRAPAVDEPVVSRVAPAQRSAGPAAGEAIDADVAAASHAIAAMRARTIAHSAGMPAPPQPILAAGSEAMAAPIVAEPEASGSWLADPRRLMEQPRIRIATGVALAILLGFLPADLFASARERSLLRPIDQQVLTTQAAADTPETYQVLDAYRTKQLAAKRGEYRWIVIEAMLIWAATSGALGYLWFWQIKWARRPDELA